MTAQIRAMLRGAGGVIDLAPAPHTYLRLIPNDTASDRLRAVWMRVGGHIRVATEKVRDGTPEAPKKAD